MHQAGKIDLDKRENVTAAIGSSSERPAELWDLVCTVPARCHESFVQATSMLGEIAVAPLSVTHPIDGDTDKLAVVTRCATAAHAACVFGAIEIIAAELSRPGAPPSLVRLVMDACARGRAFKQRKGGLPDKVRWHEPQVLPFIWDDSVNFTRLTPDLAGDGLAEPAIFEQRRATAERIAKFGLLALLDMPLSVEQIRSQHALLQTLAMCLPSVPASMGFSPADFAVIMSPTASKTIAADGMNKESLRYRQALLQVDGWLRRDSTKRLSMRLVRKRIQTLGAWICGDTVLPDADLPAGRPRTLGVECCAQNGSFYLPGEEVQAALLGLSRWFVLADRATAERRFSPIELAARSYQTLLSIHPFLDGNGRTGRAWLNWVLRRHGLPVADLLSDETNIAHFRWANRASVNASPEDAVRCTSRGLLRTLKMA